MPIVMPATVHIRRSYAECRYGQLHVATAYPSGGGFDEHTAVICLHPSGSSSRMFAPLLPELGRDRSVYALDLPGHGQSDRPASDLSVLDYANAASDFADSLRLRSFDVIGVELGALIAAELAIAKPQQVRRLVLSSVPFPLAHERAPMAGRTAPMVPTQDGAHLIKEWERLKESRGANVALDMITDQLADVLRAGREAGVAAAAMLDYASSQRLPLVKQSVLILRTRDEFSEHTSRAKAALPRATLTDVPEFGSGLFAAQPHQASQLVREFLDR
jgi:pimeloyl-ACP methyl ester carboxylesterase